MTGLANFLCSWVRELLRRHPSGGRDMVLFLVFICAMSFTVFLERMFFTYLRIKIRSLFIELELSIIYGTRLTNMPNLQPH